MEQKMDCNKTLYVANLMGDRGVQVVDKDKGEDVDELAYYL